MKKTKRQKNRAFLAKAVEGLGQSLNRLPADRQDLLNALDAGRVDGATAEPGRVSRGGSGKLEFEQDAESQTRTVSGVHIKGNGLSGRGPGQPPG